MMGRQRRDQGRLFYEFRLDDRVPQNHLLRRIDVFVTAALADLHQELEPYYSEIGRPSVDAYRWFCKLDLEDEIPHHSTFSANRVGAINFITTIFNMRAPGMTLHKNISQKCSLPRVFSVPFFSSAGAC